jgi:hypothetical protein
MSFVGTQHQEGGATVTVVSSEDQRKSEDRCKGYEEYAVQGRNQVSLEGIRF